MISDRQIAKKLEMSYGTLLRWKKDKPLLYHHIRDGFELKALALEMDYHLRAIYRQTQLIRLKERTNEMGSSRVYKVKEITCALPKELEASQFMWSKTDDLESLYVLLHKNEIVYIEDEMYINIFEYQAHCADDNTEWLISNNIHIQDMNRFFEWYSEQNRSKG